MNVTRSYEIYHDQYEQHLDDLLSFTSGHVYKEPYRSNQIIRRKSMDYEKEYGNILMSLAKAAGELTARHDIIGIRFLIECCDAVLGHALQVIGETEKAKEQGRMN